MTQPRPLTPQLRLRLRESMAVLLVLLPGLGSRLAQLAAPASVVGCTIGFVIAADKLRFDVALRHVGLSRLRISARMLAVAHKVQGAT